MSANRQAPARPIETAEPSERHAALKVRQLKTYPINLNREPGLPTGPFDPSWNDPEVGSKVAVTAYRRLRFQGRSFEEAPRAPRPAPKSVASVLSRTSAAEARRFEIAHDHEVDPTGLRVRGSSVGSLYRRVAFGGGRPVIELHAHAVTFAVDSEGRWFLRAEVGARGALEAEASIEISFLSNGAPIHGVSVSAALPRGQETRVEMLGTEPALRDAFDRIDHAELIYRTSYKA